MSKVQIAKVLEGNDIIELEGVVKEITDDNIILDLVGGGEVTINKEDLLEPLTDKVIDNSNTEEVKTVEKSETVVVKKLPALKPGSKLARVVELCDANPNLKRKELIALIVQNGIMASEAGASTYHQNAKPYLKVNQK
jgi:hypothetical protein